jgi:hypothetical protein
MVNGISTVEDWIRDTGETTERVMFSNYLSLSSNLDSISDMADSLSQADTIQLSQFSEVNNIVPFKDEMLGRSIQKNTHPTRDPPKYTLSPYPCLKKSQKSENCQNNHVDCPRVLLESNKEESPFVV